ncbi:MAG: hypothetical protein HONDAALG_03004 [Gammaproteobacteria bacterium]|nr:hypothetical protein [Gammaproteobacteria bacterium]
MANFKHFVIGKRARRTVGEIAQVHRRAHEAASRLRVRRNPEPFVQSPALVRLEVAESDPAQRRWSDDGRDGFKRDGETLLEPRVHQKRLVVFYENLVELDAVIRMKRGDSVNIRRDFIHFAVHVISLPG